MDTFKVLKLSDFFIVETPQKITKKKPPTVDIKSSTLVFVQKCFNLSPDYWIDAQSMIINNFVLAHQITLLNAFH